MKAEQDRGFNPNNSFDSSEWMINDVSWGAPNQPNDWNSVVRDMKQESSSSFLRDVQIFGESANSVEPNQSASDTASGSSSNSSPSQKDIDQLVDGLRSDKFKDRDTAAKKLVEMGPAAEETLKKFIGGNDDMERQTKAILDEIDYKKIEPKLKLYAEMAKTSAEEMKKLGLDPEEFSPFSKDRKQGPPTKEDRAAFEKIIQNSDIIDENPNYRQEVGRYRGSDVSQDMFMKQKDIASNVRLAYADALSKSPDPMDREKAINLLTEHIQKNDDKFSSAIETRTLAKELGADKDEKFMKTFKEATGGLVLLEGGEGGNRDGPSNPGDNHPPAPPPSTSP